MRILLILIAFLILPFSNSLAYDQTLSQKQFDNAQRAFKKQKFDDAINFYLEAVKNNPFFAKAYFGLGFTYTLQNRLKEAMTYYNKAISIKPRFAQAHFGLAWVQLLENRLDDALGSYRKAILLNPKSPEIHVGLGRVYYKLKNYYEAIASYSNAILLNPENPNAHYGLGLVYNAIKEGKKAIIHTRKAKNFFKENNNFLWAKNADLKLKFYYKTYGVDGKLDNSLKKKVGVQRSIQDKNDLTFKQNNLSANGGKGIREENILENNLNLENTLELMETTKGQITKTPNGIDSLLKEKEGHEEGVFKADSKFQKERKSIESLKYQLEKKMSDINSWLKGKKDYEKQLFTEGSKLRKERKLIESLKYQLEHKLSNLKLDWNRKHALKTKLRKRKTKVEKARRSVGDLRSNLAKNYKKENASLRKAGIVELGEGFLFSVKNYVITSSQLIKKAQIIKIKLITGEKIDAEVLIDDAQSGLAVLKPEKHLPSPEGALIIGNSSKLNIGDKIFTIDWIGSIPRYTEGFIHSLNGVEKDPGVFQYRMQAYPINSGAPIFNENGEVIGVTKTTIALKEANENLKKIPKVENYAVKSDRISKLLTLLPKTQTSLSLLTLDLGSHYSVAKFLEKIKRAIVQIEVNKSYYES